MVFETELYDILNVSPNCSRNELKKAFKVKALKLHPDRNQAGPKAIE
jgi:DnaJ family protein A protein 2